MKGWLFLWNGNRPFSLVANWLDKPVGFFVKTGLEATGEYHETRAKTLDPLFAPPRFIEQSFQSHVRAVRPSPPLVFRRSAQDSGQEHAELQYHCVRNRLTRKR